MNSIIWQVSATGIDDQGRAFTITVVGAAVTPPTPTPPPSTGISGRLEVWGDPNYAVYLGCWSCNEFDSESVFNQFGRYGSRFSSTSISNHFSQYGSPFSSYSACNEFTSLAPRLINISTNRYNILTLNRFVSFAITDPATVNYLRRTICEL